MEKLRGPCAITRDLFHSAVLAALNSNRSNEIPAQISTTFVPSMTLELVPSRATPAENDRAASTERGPHPSAFASSTDVMRSRMPMPLDLDLNPTPQKRARLMDMGEPTAIGSDEARTTISSGPLTSNDSTLTGNNRSEARYFQVRDTPHNLTSPTETSFVQPTMKSHGGHSPVQEQHSPFPLPEVLKLEFVVSIGAEPFIFPQAATELHDELMGFFMKVETIDSWFTEERETKVYHGHAMRGNKQAIDFADKVADKCNSLLDDFQTFAAGLPSRIDQVVRSAERQLSLLRWEGPKSLSTSQNICKSLPPSSFAPSISGH